MSARGSPHDSSGEKQISQDFEAGLAHQKAGRRDRAEALYRKVLRRAPGHVDALHLLGVIAYDRGEAERALQLLSRAVAGRPSFADAHQNLGVVLQAMSRFDEAEARYRTAIALKPESAHAHSNLASILNRRDDYKAALESATRAVERKPDLFDGHFHRGVALMVLRRFAEAEAAYRRALELRPDRPEALSDLGHVLTELRRPAEAIACHQKTVERQPDNAQFHLRLAAAHYYNGDPRASEASCRRAISLSPRFALGWCGLGQVLRSLGRFEEARTHLRHALELDPDLAEAYAGLAVLGQCGGEEQIARLRLLLSPNSPAGIRIDAGFALGLLLDNADRCDDAFPCFAVANSLYCQALTDTGERYDEAALRRQVDTLIATCTADFFSVIEGEGNPSEAPVLIVGMPRSGTSLVEQIAATHSRVFGAGELPDIRSIVNELQSHAIGRREEELDPDLGRRLADGYVARLAQLSNGAERVIDKMPDNILHLGMVGVLFPRARIIFCRRDPRDTCLSCYFRRFDQPIPWAYDLVDSASRILEIERLADHWRQVLPLRMLTIDYETLVADLAGESRRLIEFLGLDWEPACLDFHKTDRPVLTASGWQVRQPIYDRSVGRWRKYARHLGPLLNILGR